MRNQNSEEDNVRSARSVTIQPEGIATIPELRDLWLALHHHHAAVGPQSGKFVDDATSWRERESSYRNWLNDPPSFLLVAREREIPIGYAMVRVFEADSELRDTWEVPPRLGELETLVVSRANRGTGVGSRLMDEVEATLDELGITEIVIGLIPGNDEAKRLYESRGFQPRWLQLARGSWSRYES